MGGGGKWRGRRGNGGFPRQLWLWVVGNVFPSNVHRPFGGRNRRCSGWCVGIGSHESFGRGTIRTVAREAPADSGGDAPRAVVTHPPPAQPTRGYRQKREIATVSAEVHPTWGGFKVDGDHRGLVHVGAFPWTPEGGVATCPATRQHHGSIYMSFKSDLSGIYVMAPEEFLCLSPTSRSPRASPSR